MCVDKCTENVWGELCKHMRKEVRQAMHQECPEKCTANAFVTLLAACIFSGLACHSAGCLHFLRVGLAHTNTKSNILAACILSGLVSQNYGGSLHLLWTGAWHAFRLHFLRGWLIKLYWLPALSVAWLAQDKEIKKIQI